MFGRKSEDPQAPKNRARDEVRTVLDELQRQRAEQGDTAPEAGTPLEVALGNLDYFNTTVRTMEGLNQFLQENNRALSLSSNADRRAGANVLFNAPMGVFEETSATVGLSWAHQVYREPVTPGMLIRGAMYGRGSVDVLAQDRTELLSRVLKQIK